MFLTGLSNKSAITAKNISTMAASRNRQKLNQSASQAEQFRRKPVAISTQNKVSTHDYSSTAKDECGAKPQAESLMQLTKTNNNNIKTKINNLFACDNDKGDTKTITPPLPCTCNCKSLETQQETPKIEIPVQGSSGWNCCRCC